MSISYTPADAALFRANFRQAWQMIGELAQMGTNAEANFAIQNSIAPKLQSCILGLTSPQRRMIRRVMDAVGLGTMSDIFPPPPIHETPSTESDPAVSIVDVLANAPASQLAYACFEAGKRRSTETSPIFYEMAHRFEERAKKIMSGLKEETASRVPDIGST